MTDVLANPRDLAFSALRDRAGNVSARLDSLLGRCRLPPQDRALAMEIALGVVRRRGTLEAVLRAFLLDPGRALPGPLTAVLEMGLYQLLLLDRVPDFAAVNEAVEQAARVGHKRKAGLVNGVLRAVARAAGAVEAGAPPLAADAVPVGPWAFRRMGRAVFANPAERPDEWLAQAYSLPVELARRWLGRLGSLERAAAVAAHGIARPAQVLRVNSLRTDVTGAVEALAAEGVAAAPHANGLSVVLTEHHNVAALRALAEGLVQPQDPTATAVVVEAAPRPGMKVLDFCAAPGTKTTHLAERMSNSGQIVAVDVSADKLARIEQSCLRMGATIVTTHLADRAGELPAEGFDLVLADVPCSNTGVLARRVEARWRFTPEALERLVADQRVIAAAASRFVRPGGMLVYSTCSIEPEENAEVAAWLVAHERRLELLRERATEPGGADDPARWHDGGYCAIFRAR